MVFFTCFHCGESVKKPSVSKHYLTKCRNKDPFLTCVDCMKDFKGTEYEAHTKCMTEEERYSGKGFVPKSSQKKGERKQQAWQECIQTVLKKPTLRQDERDLIKAISKYENVPRKKAKFVNFLTNAFRNCTNKNDLIDRVWVEMESVFKESFGSFKEEQPKQKKENIEGEKKLKGHENIEIKESLEDENILKKEKKRKRKAEENKVVPTSDSEKINEKSKKKKAKHSEENAAAVEGNIAVLLSDEQQEKKSRKRKAGDKDEIEQNGSVADEAESGKKKKKKKHDKVTDDQTVSQATEQNTEHNDEKVAQKKKKKKKSKSESSNVNSNVAEVTPVPECGRKSGKKTKMSDNKENCVEKDQKEMNAEGNIEKPVPMKNKSESENKQETFDWKATILQVLNQEGKNKKIPIQKLQKKVLKLHCKILNCESSAKKEKKFLKKLKEMSQVEVDEDLVVLKS